MRSCVKGLCSAAGKARRPKEEVTDHGGGGANDTFGPTVLWRGVRVQEARLNAMEEEGARGSGVELSSFITLKGTNKVTELCGDPGEEVGEDGKGVGLQPKRESPKKVREVIQND
jgi:hypothetical protein